MAVGGWIRERALVRWLVAAAMLATALVVPVVPALTSATAAPAAPAAAAKAAKSPPVYRTGKYHGTTKIPKTAPPTLLPPVVLGDGNAPSVVVDAAGTAHIAWTSGDGDLADAVHYCRLERGASSCDHTELIRPEPPPSSDYNPAYNIDYGGPKLYAIGDQLVLLSHRASTAGYTHPDGSLGGTTVVYTSEDGGTTWSGGQQLGTGDITGPGAVYGTDLDPRIATINTLDTDGTIFQSLSPAAFTSATADLGPTLAEGSGGSVATDADPDVPGGRLPVAAFHGPDGDTIALRRWGGSGDINDVSTWGDTTVLPGDDPQLAGGPSGLYLLDHDVDSSALSIHPLAGVTERPGTKISGSDATQEYLAEGPDGSLYAAWTGDADHPDLRFTSDRGGIWSSAHGQPILRPGTTVDQTVVAAATDGGGFAVVREPTGTGGEGTIVAVPFGTQNPTGQPGLGTLSGGDGDDNVTTSCTTVAFGALTLHPAEGCFLHGTGQAANLDVADGTITLNGLAITPVGDTQIILDAHHHTIDSSGPVTVQIPGNGTPNIVLWQGEIHLKLPDAGVGQTLFDFPTSAFPARVDGFPIDTHAPVQITKDGVKIPIDITLPAGFGGNLGHAVLDVGPDGLDTKTLKIAIPDGTDLGFASLDGVTLSFTGGSWTGKGTIDAGGMSLTVELAFKDGSFDHGSVTVSSFPGVPVWAPADLYLNQVGLGVYVNPLKITGTAKLGAVPLVDPDYLASVVGGLALQFSPFDVRITADGYLLNTEVGNATLEFGGGALSFAGSVDLEVADTGIVGQVHALISQHQVAGSISAQVCAFGACIPAAELSVSNVGASFCFPIGIDLGPIKIHPSVTHDWDSLIPVVPHISCVHEDGADAGDDRRSLRARPRGAATAAEPLSFTVPHGAVSYDVELDAAAGGPAPAVTVIGPDGAPVSLGTYAKEPDGVMTLGSSTFIGLAAPAPGTYLVTLQPGSAPVSAERTSRGYATPSVGKGKVTGTGHVRTLHYHLTPVPGVGVDFVEHTSRGDHVLGTATRAHGTLRFTPGPGKAGRRTIYARAVTSSEAVRIATVASYLAPKPAAPARVRGLSVRIRHGRLLIRFHRSAGASRYRVVVRLPHRRTVSRYLTAPQTSLTLSGIKARTHVTVTVTAMAADGTAAKPSSAHQP